MPYNGAGVFTPSAADFPAVAGTTIFASKYNNVINDVATGLTTALTKDGQTTATANLPMGGFKHTGVADATARTQYATWGQMQDSLTAWAGTAGGTADALTLTPAPGISAYAAGNSFIFLAASDNTGAATVAVNGLTAKAITIEGQALIAGDIRANKFYRITYTPSGDFQLACLTDNPVKNVRSNSGNATLNGAWGGRLTVQTNDGVLTFAATTTLSIGEFVRIKSLTHGSVTLVPDGTDTFDGVNATYRLPSFCEVEVQKLSSGAWVFAKRPEVQVGDLRWMAHGTAPTGWLKCGQAVSRTTYAGLYAVIGTTFGVGDGSTTFDLPDHRGRSLIGAGTGTLSEISTAASGNGFVVAANNSKWITGMPVVVSNLSGFTFSGSTGVTYYAVRVSSTNVRLATTLALAQAGTPDLTLTASGTDSAILTTTLTARTLAEKGGEETHAMSSTELLAHVHAIGNFSGPRNLTAGPVSSWEFTGSTNVNSTGGNAAMNNMSPFLTAELYIKT